MVRLREKEEKEAKRRRRLADDFTDLLHSLKVMVTLHWKYLFMLC